MPVNHVVDLGSDDDAGTLIDLIRGGRDLRVEFVSGETSGQGHRATLSIDIRGCLSMEDARSRILAVARLAQRQMQNRS